MSVLLSPSTYHSVIRPTCVDCVIGHPLHTCRSLPRIATTSPVFTIDCIYTQALRLPSREPLKSHGMKALSSCQYIISSNSFSFVQLSPYARDLNSTNPEMFNVPRPNANPTNGLASSYVEDNPLFSSTYDGMDPWSSTPVMPNSTSESTLEDLLGMQMRSWGVNSVENSI